MRYPDRTPIRRRYLRLVRRDIPGDVDDELRFHFDTRVEELIERGASLHEARAQALREFGDVDAVRDGLVAIDTRVARTRRRIDWLRDLAADVRYAARALWCSPGVALGILATLTLGVGVNAAMFTVIDTIFLRLPAGVATPQQVRRLWTLDRFVDGPQFWSGFSYIQYDAARAALGTDVTEAIYRAPRARPIGGDGAAGDAQVSYASASLFPVLGVHARLGRVYARTEDRLDGAAAVAVISDDYWARAFGRDDRILGRPLIVAGQRFTIIGVTPAEFAGADLDRTDIWLPLAWGAGFPGLGQSWWTNQNVNGFQVLLRLPASSNDLRVEQQLTAALRRPDVAPIRADSNAVARLGSILQANGPGKMSQESEISLRLSGVAIIVLLIACANVVNLLLARAVRRRREIAVRLALGISRWRLVRLLLAESALLATAAAGLALLVAYWGGALLRVLLMPEVHWARSPIDSSTIALSLAISLGAGLIAGAIPALQAANPDLVQALRGGASSGVARHALLRRWLVAAQAALSVVLLVGAVLFVRSLSNVRALDLGYDTARLMYAGISPPRSQRFDPKLEAARIAEASQRAASLPGVQSIALTSTRPMMDLSFTTFFTDGHELPAHANPTLVAVSPPFFATTGLRVLQGNAFPPAGSAAQTVVVNATMARLVWPGRDALGHCMYIGAHNAPCSRVVGVVADSRQGRLIENPQPQFFLPLSDLPDSTKEFAGLWMVVRTDPAQQAVVQRALASLLRDAFPGATPRFTLLSDFLEPQFRPWRLGATLFSAFGVLALIVAVVGMYSMVSYDVNQRAQEFGVRIALGATLGGVVRLVVAAGLRTVAAGIVLGAALALSAGRFVASLLYGVRPTDPSVFVIVALVLLGSGALAALLPAWRAARADPASALRAE